MTSSVDLVTASAADLAGDKEEKRFHQMNFEEKKSYIQDIITVEPLLTAYIMASYLCFPALLNLELKKACRVNLEFNNTVCEAILTSNHDNYTELNFQVLGVISDMHSWQQPVQSIVPTILILFIGSYSDRHKWRKPFMLLPIFGEFFAVAGCILCVIFMDSWPLEVQGIFQTIVPSFFGGLSMTIMAVFSYIADVSTIEKRTLRIGVVQIVMNIAGPLTYLTGAYLFNFIGYIGILLIASALLLFAVLYGIFWIKEPKQPIKTTGDCICLNVFNPVHVLDTFNLLSKKSPGNNRLYIWVVLGLLFLYNVVGSGEESVFFLFVQSSLHWTIVAKTNFDVANTLIHWIADLAGDKEEKRFRQMNFEEKKSYIRDIITVEPLLTAYIMASYLCAPALLNLEFEKACRVNLEFNNTVCEAILSGNHDNYTEQNFQVLEVISDMHSWQQPVQSIVPMILILFLGSYSDRHKWRKPFMLLPIFGEFFAVAGCILCVIFMDSWPLEVQGIFQTIVPSFFGGLSMMIMAVFSYIADVSTIEMRTLRIGVVQIVLNIATPLTGLISAYLFNLIGYYGILLIASALFLFAVLYGIFWIKEPKQPIKTTGEYICLDVFNPVHVADTFNLLFKKSPGNNRLYIWVVLGLLFLYNVVVAGEQSVFFLFTQSYLHWTIVAITNLNVANLIIHLIGTMVGVTLFAKFFNFSDMTILLIAFLNKICSNIIFAFSSTTVMLYLASVVSLFIGLISIGIRSLQTKLVSEDDLGKAQSLFGVCEAIGQAVAAPVYNTLIFNPTKKSYPPAFFFLGIFLYILGCLVIVWMIFKSKVKPLRSDQQGPTTENGDKAIPLENREETTRI